MRRTLHEDLITEYTEYAGALAGDVAIGTLRRDRPGEFPLPEETPQLRAAREALQAAADALAAARVDYLVAVKRRLAELRGDR